MSITKIITFGELEANQICMKAGLLPISTTTTFDAPPHIS